jgi:hypothetical protein
MSGRRRNWHAMLADAGLVISAGKMSPTCGRAGRSRSGWEDLQVICSTLGWHPQRSARPGTGLDHRPPPPSSGSEAGRPAGTQQPELRAAAGEGPIRRRHAGETTGVSTRRRRGPRDYRGPARSCEQCYGWGVLRGRLCRGCEAFHRQYPVGTCVTCRRPGRPGPRGGVSTVPQAGHPHRRTGQQVRRRLLRGGGHRTTAVLRRSAGVQTHPASHGRRPATRPRLSGR